MVMPLASAALWAFGWPDVVYLVVGGLISYCFQQLLHRANRPLRSLTCDIVYCSDLLADITAPLGDAIEVRSGGKRLTSPVIVNVRVRSIGNETVTNCKLSIFTPKSDCIRKHEIQWPQRLHHERVTESMAERHRLQFTIAYLNSRDYFNVFMLISPCENADCISVEIDAADTKIVCRPSEENCDVQVPKTWQ